MLIHLNVVTRQITFYHYRHEGKPYNSYQPRNLLIPFSFNVLRGILLENFHIILRGSRDNLPCTFVFFCHDHSPLRPTSHSTRLVLIQYIIYTLVLFYVHNSLIETTRNYSTHANNTFRTHPIIIYYVCLLFTSIRTVQI